MHSLAACKYWLEVVVFSCLKPLQINGQTHCQRIPLGYDDSSSSGPHSWPMLWYVATPAHIVFGVSPRHLLTHTMDGSVA